MRDETKDASIIKDCSLCYGRCTGWLRLVGSLKLKVSFAEYRLFHRALLQMRPIIFMETTTRSHHISVGGLDFEFHGRHIPDFFS